MWLAQQKASFSNKRLSSAIKYYIAAFNVTLYCTRSIGEAINQMVSPKWSFLSYVVSEGLIHSSESVHPNLSF